jgi:hypothetical protein
MRAKRASIFAALPPLPDGLQWFPVHTSLKIKLSLEPLI